MLLRSSLFHEYHPIVHIFHKLKSKMIPFAFAVLHDCEAELGLSLSHVFIPGYNSLPLSIVQSTLSVPKRSLFKYSADLWIYYQRLWRYIEFEKKDKTPILIGALLRFLLYQKSDFTLRSNASLSWRGARDRFIGSCEVLIGPSNFSIHYNMIISFPPQEKSFSESTSYVLTQAACLLKNRLAKGQGFKVPTLAVLTNCTDFRFFVVDTDGLVFGSRIFQLTLSNEPERDLISSPCAEEWQLILMYFQWFLELSQKFSSCLEVERMLAITELRAQCTRLV
jgi:hypothetical protein